MYGSKSMQLFAADVDPSEDAKTTKVSPFHYQTMSLEIKDFRELNFIVRSYFLGVIFVTPIERAHLE